MGVSNPAVFTFSLSALLGSFGENVPRDRFQDPTLRQNSNGSWYIRPWVDTVTANGIERKKKQIVLGSASMGKRDAMTAKRRVMDTINRASYVVQSQIPFSALLDEYVKRHFAQLGIAAQKKYESLIKNHIRPAFAFIPEPGDERPAADLQLHEITTQRVQDWINAKAIPGEHFKSWSTRADLRNLMSGIFEQAIAWKYWQEANPITRVTAGRKRLIRKKIKLTDDQTRKLLAALPAQVRTLASVALFCGLRISEVLGLQEKHVDLNNGILVIEQRFHRGNLDVVKNRKAERSVPVGYMVDDMRLLCMGDPDRFVFQVQTKAGRPGPHQKHFVCRDDRGLLQHFLRPAAKQIGCYSQGFGWHSLRREAVTAFNASLGVTQAMNLAGHSSVEMSAEYTLADRAAQDAAVRERQVKLMGVVAP